VTTEAPRGFTLAILGGGQLGRMLALSAIPLGVTVRSLDPVDGAPASVVSASTVGALDDPVALGATVAGADVITFEWEGVPAGPVRALVAEGGIVRPSVDALEVSQDRVHEKTTFRGLGIPVADFASVDEPEDLVTAVAAVGTPGILKTRRGGYDGKGQARVDAPGDAATAAAALRDGGPLILERRIEFDRELSIIAVRGVDGEVRTWPLVENEHRGGILRTSHAPAAGVDGPLQASADAHVRAVLEYFDYVGVLTLELFQVGDRLLVNEMAPRVHNSGHWTIEGAETSQFEQHLRAVLGWPLGAADPRGCSAMVNCIGTLPDRAAVLGVPGAHLHDYGKAPRRGRKVGHVTVCAADDATLDERLARVLALQVDEG
jgi:5-(carboxyamino)imidazole ribonucleotide synthase